MYILEDMGLHFNAPGIRSYREIYNLTFPNPSTLKHDPEPFSSFIAQGHNKNLYKAQNNPKKKSFKIADSSPMPPGLPVAPAARVDAMLAADPLPKHTAYTARIVSACRQYIQDCGEHHLIVAVPCTEHSTISAYECPLCEGAYFSSIFLAPANLESEFKAKNYVTYKPVKNPDIIRKKKDAEKREKARAKADEARKLPLTPEEIDRVKARRREGLSLSRPELNLLERERQRRLDSPVQKAKRRAKRDRRLARDHQLSPLPNGTPVIGGVRIDEGLYQAFLGNKGSKAKRNAKRLVQKIVNDARATPGFVKESATSSFTAQGGGIADFFDSVFNAAKSFFDPEAVALSLNLARFLLSVLVAIRSVLNWMDGRIAFQDALLALLAVGVGIAGDGIQFSSYLTSDPSKTLAQGPGDTVATEGIIGSVINWVHNFLLGSNSDYKTDHLREKRISGIAGMFTSLKKIVEHFTDFITWIWSTVYEWITGSSWQSRFSLEVIQEYTNHISEFASDLANIAHLKEQSTSDVRIRRSVLTRLSSYPLVRDRMQRVCNIESKHNSTLIAGERVWNEWHREVAVQITQVQDASKAATTPITVLYGGTGIGKSHLFKALISPYKSNQVFQRSEDSSYVDGYNADTHKVWYIDDLFQKLDPDDRTSLALELVHMGSDTPYALNSAAISGKGVTTFNAEMVVATTNVRNWSTLKVTAHEAIGRRINQFIWVRPNPAFVTNFGELNNIESTKTAKWKKGIETTFSLGVSLDTIYDFFICRFNNHYEWVPHRQVRWEEVRKIAHERTSFDSIDYAALSKTRPQLLDESRDRFFESHDIIDFIAYTQSPSFSMPPVDHLIHLYNHPELIEHISNTGYINSSNIKDMIEPLLLIAGTSVHVNHSKRWDVEFRNIQLGDRSIWPIVSDPMSKVSNDYVAPLLDMELPAAYYNRFPADWPYRDKWDRAVDWKHAIPAIPKPRPITVVRTTSTPPTLSPVETAPLELDLAEIKRLMEIPQSELSDEQIALISQYVEEEKLKETFPDDEDDPVIQQGDETVEMVKEHISQMSVPPSGQIYDSILKAAQDAKDPRSLFNTEDAPFIISLGEHASGTYTEAVQLDDKKDLNLLIFEACELLAGHQRNKTTMPESWKENADPAKAMAFQLQKENWYDQLRKHVFTATRAIGRKADEVRDQIDVHLNDKIFAPIKTEAYARLWGFASARAAKWILPPILILVTSIASVALIGSIDHNPVPKMRSTHPEWFDTPEATGYDRSQPAKPKRRPKIITSAKPEAREWLSVAQADFLTRTFEVLNVDTHDSAHAFAVGQHTFLANRHVTDNCCELKFFSKLDPSRNFTLDPDDFEIGHSGKADDLAVIKIIRPERSIPGVKAGTVDGEKFAAELESVYSLRFNSGVPTWTMIRPDDLVRATSSVMHSDHGRCSDTDNLVSYNYTPSTFGDCGLPLMGITHSKEAVLIGVHAGSNTTKCFAAGTSFDYLADNFPVKIQGRHSVRIHKWKKGQRDTINLRYLGSINSLGLPYAPPAIPRQTQLHLAECAPALRQEFKAEIEQAGNPMPAALEIFGPPNNTIDPLMVALSKYKLAGHSPLRVPVSFIYDWFQRNLTCRPSNPQPPPSKAKFGEALTNFHRGAVEQTTSAGWPWNRRKNKNGAIMAHRSDCFLDDDHLEPLVSEAALLLFNDWSSNRSDNSVFYYASLKDELRPQESVEIGKTRLFQVAPIHLLVLAQITTKWLTDFIHSNFDRPKSSIMIGINAHGRNWAHLHAKHNSFENHCDGDFSSYDYTQENWWRPLVHKVIEYAWNSNFKEPMPQEYSYLYEKMLEDIMNAKMVIGDSIFQAYQGNATGQPLTADFNSIITSIAISYALDILGVEDYALSVYGDDSVISWNGHSELPTQIAETLQQMGFVWTSASSKARAPTVVTLPNIQFLKRRFVNVDGDITAPRQFYDMVAKLQYYQKNPASWKAKFESFLDDLSHDPNRDEHLARIRKALNWYEPHRWPTLDRERAEISIGSIPHYWKSLVSSVKEFGHETDQFLDVDPYAPSAVPEIAVSPIVHIDKTYSLRRRVTNARLSVNFFNGGMPRFVTNDVLITDTCTYLHRQSGPSQTRIVVVHDGKAESYGVQDSSIKWSLVKSDMKRPSLADFLENPMKFL